MVRAICQESDFASSNTVNKNFDRPSHSYDVSRIITIPSLADVLVSEEHLLKAGITRFPLCTSGSPDVFDFRPYRLQATLDIVAQFEAGVPVRKNSRGLGLNGGFGGSGVGGVHPSLVKLERGKRIRVFVT